MRNPYIRLLTTAWKYAGREKKRFVLIYCMFIAANITVAMNPLFYGWFINELQQNGPAVLATGWTYVVGFLALRLLEWLFHGPARVMERQLAFNVGSNFLDEMYGRVLRLPVKWHQDNHSGSTISRLRKAHEALRDFFQHGFIYLYSFGKFAFSFAAMLYFSPVFGSIGVCLGVITVAIIMRFDRPFIRTLRDVNAKEHEVSSALFDGLSNIVTVITLRLEKSIQTGLMKKVASVFPPFDKNVKINEWKWFTAQMMIGLIYGVTTIGYIYQHYTPGDPFMIGGLIILLGYVNQFTSVFNDIASQYTQIVKYDTDVQNARDFEAASPRVKRDGATFLPPWSRLEISHLNFRREQAARPGAFSGVTDISFHLEKGKRIALIGESGSGKSTLLALLRGLYEPSAGTVVKVNGNVHADFAAVSDTVTLFPQEPEIFENTIRYNITLGLPFSDEQVMAVCRIARFDGVVKHLQHGLDTPIQEKGVNLSGGQKQRLALARGILAARDSSIVLLDEPTSNIDPRTEKLIYNEMFECFAAKGLISSLHRLHLLPAFDYIYIMRDGSIVDEGTFADLSRYSLLFKEMWEHQATVAEPDPSDSSKWNIAL